MRGTDMKAIAHQYLVAQLRNIPHWNQGDQRVVNVHVDLLQYYTYMITMSKCSARIEQI